MYVAGETEDSRYTDRKISQSTMCFLKGMKGLEVYEADEFRKCSYFLPSESTKSGKNIDIVAVDNIHTGISNVVAEIVYDITSTGK